MKKILVVGSLNMDITLRLNRVPDAGETITAKSVTTSPGGKGANQAYAAGKLGGDVAMLGAVGKDAHGDELCRNLASVGVDVSGIRHIEGVSTGTAIIFVEENGENRIALASGTNALVDINYIDEQIDKITACDIVILQLEIPIETVLYVARTAKRLGKTVIIDPAPATSNIPKELWTYADYIKPNLTELNMILTGKTSGLLLEDAIKELRHLGVKQTWITLGSEGVLMVDETGEEHRIPAIPVKAVDTTAAGDSFLAAAAVCLSQGKQPQEAIAYGNRVAAIAVTREGAQQSVPTKEEVM